MSYGSSQGLGETYRIASSLWRAPHWCHTETGWSGWPWPGLPCIHRSSSPRYRLAACRQSANCRADIRPPQADRTLRPCRAFGRLRAAAGSPDRSILGHRSALRCSLSCPRDRCSNRRATCLWRVVYLGRNSWRIEGKIWCNYYTKAS